MDFDKDLAARQEARLLCRQAEKAQKILAQMGQEKLDAIVEAMAKAFSASAVELAELAVRETGFGNTEDKITKNRFASETVADAVRGMKTVGVLKGESGDKLWEVGVPVGVILYCASRSAAPHAKSFCIAASPAFRTPEGYTDAKLASLTDDGEWHKIEIDVRKLPETGACYKLHFWAGGMNGKPGSEYFLDDLEISANPESEK